MSEPVEQDEIIDIAQKLAQTLYEFIEDAEQAGNEDPLPEVKELLGEWEDIYKRTRTRWMDILADSNEMEDEHKWQP